MWAWSINEAAILPGQDPLIRLFVWLHSFQLLMDCLSLDLDSARFTDALL
jgi:hypothetical protein